MALHYIFCILGEDCCWDVVDSSTEKLLADVPLHPLDSVNVPVSMESLRTLDEEPTNDVKIPMQEELEVRLEEGSFPVSSDWPYVFKMEQDIVSAALQNNPNNFTTNDPSISNETYPKSITPEKTIKTEFFPSPTLANQVKLELEVTLTPETACTTDNLVTSSLASTSSPLAVNKNSITTVIPPTTIVCLPSVVPSSSKLQGTAQILSTNMASIPPPRTAMVPSSSAAVPFLTLSTSQPIRAVPQPPQQAQINTKKTKPQSIASSAGGSSGRNRNTSNKPPPGAVNLERSYQICQAVIQNSPNRDQLRCQLKPPPSLLAAAVANNSQSSKKSATQYSNVSSSKNSGKVFTQHHLPQGNIVGTGPTNITVKSPIMIAANHPNNKMINNVVRAAVVAAGNQRQQQPSPPVVVRHVFTSNQGIPVTMAVLPQSQSADVSKFY